MKPIQLIVFIIWGALCSSLIMYIVVLNVITFAPAKEAHDSPASIFALVAGAMAPLTFVLRKVLLGGFSAGKLKVDNPAGRNRFVAGNIVIFAMCEGMGVLGFVNGLLSHGGRDAWLPFIGGSLILLLCHIPLPSRFEPSPGNYRK